MKKILAIILTLCSFAFCEFTLETEIDNAVYPMDSCKKIKSSKSLLNNSENKKMFKNAIKVAYECKTMDFYMVQSNNKTILFLAGRKEYMDNIFYITLLIETNWKTSNGDYVDMGIGKYEEYDENDIIIISKESPYNEYNAIKSKIFEIYDAIKTNSNHKPTKESKCPPSWQDEHGDCKKGW